MNPILLTDVQSAGHADEVGFFGIALSHNAKVKKWSNRLARYNNKIDRLVEKISRAEDKLEDLGVDPDDLYAGWGFEDVKLDRTRSSNRGPYGGRTPDDPYGGRTPRGGRGLEDDDYDDDPRESAGLVLVGRLW